MRGLFMEADMAKGKGMDAKAFVKKYGLNVEGYLDLEGTQITALPDNLTALRLRRNRFQLGVSAVNCP